MRTMWLGAGVLAAAMMIAPAHAQVRTIDPNQPIDGDLRGGAAAASARAAARSAAAPPVSVPTPPRAADMSVDAGAQDSGPPPTEPGPAPSTTAQRSTSPAPAGAVTPDSALAASETYHRDDLISAGEGVFGKGAAGLGGIIERILKEQGEPNGYIAGREASGAIIVGLRYGSGTLTHKVEGQSPVYWTGPSVGFDLGGDAAKVFVLVYNLYDTEDLFKRFPAGEGRLYAVGGFGASYLRWGKVVLIPVRLGVGWRAGVNLGYMKFSHTAKWMPF